MKKIVFVFSLIILMFCIDSNVFASTNKQIMKCNELTEKAQNAYNLDTAISAVECNLRLDKDWLNVVDRVNIENSMRKNLVLMNIQRHEITKDDKYIKNAKKYATELINNNTKETDMIKIAIMLNSLTLDDSNMIKAYDYLCSVDQKIGFEYKNDFINMLANTREVMAINKSQEKEKRKNTLKKVAAALNGVSNYS